MQHLVSLTSRETATAVILEASLSVGESLTKELVAQINTLCDQAEDAAVGSIVRINLESHHRAEARRSDGSHTIDINLVNHWERALRRLECTPCVTVAVATDDIGGLSLALLLCTDCRVVGESTRLGLSHAGQTRLPGMVLYRLSHQLGPMLSRRMALLNRWLSSQEALQHGLVDAVSSQPSLAVHGLMQELQQHDLTHASLHRRLILEAPSVSYENALGSHLAACDRILRQAQAGLLTTAAKASCPTQPQWGTK